MVDFKRVCNFCKKQFDQYDTELDFGFDMILPYGSEHDMAHLRLDVCSHCFDKMMDDYIIPNCQINPLVEVMDEDEVPWEEFED